MRHLRTFVASGLMLVASQAWAIKPFSADYDANWKGVQATAQMVLSQTEKNRWSYELSVNNQLGSTKQSTVFEERNGQYRPLSGSDHLQVLFKKVSIQAAYDWTRGEANWSGDIKADRAGPIKLQEGDLDSLLLNLAIIRDVATGKPLTYRLVDNGSVRQQTYQNLGRETITVDGKPHDAIKVARNSDDRQVIVWVVKGFPTPIRILQRKGDKDELELTLRSMH
jgi:hypothetical protein